MEEQRADATASFHDPRQTSRSRIGRGILVFSRDGLIYLYRRIIIGGHVLVLEIGGHVLVLEIHRHAHGSGIQQDSLFAAELVRRIRGPQQLVQFTGSIVILVASQDRNIGLPIDIEDPV
jgi:hypothetical protein